MKRRSKEKKLTGRSINEKKCEERRRKEKKLTGRRRKTEWI